MIHWIRAVLMGVLSFGLFACSENLHKKVADTATDAALLFEAGELLDEQDYIKALQELQKVSDLGKSQRQYKVLNASAQAGVCGLNFVNYFTRISDAASLNSSVFEFLMAGFQGTSVAPSYCQVALEQMQDVAGSDDIGRDGDDQLFLAILSMANIGASLASKADTDSDATIDFGFNICEDSGADTVSDSQVAQMLASFGTILLNVGGLVGGDSVVSEVEDIAANCETLSTSGSNPCELTKPDQVDANSITFMRKLLHAEGFGPSTGCTSTDPLAFANNCCP